MSDEQFGYLKCCNEHSCQYPFEHVCKNPSSLEYELRNGIISSIQCKLTRFGRFIAKADTQTYCAVGRVRNNFVNLYL